MKMAARAFLGGFFGTLGITSAILGTGAVVGILARRQLADALEGFNRG
jgi:hypothetical protein